MTLHELQSRRADIAAALPGYTYLCVSLSMGVYSYSKTIDTQPAEWVIYAANFSGQSRDADLRATGETLDEAIANAKAEAARRATDLAGEIEKKRAELAELVLRATESAAKKTAEADFGEIVGTHDGEPQ